MARTRYLEKMVNGRQYSTLVEAINAGAIQNYQRQYNSTKKSLLVMGLDFNEKALAQAMYVTARQAIVDIVEREMNKTNVYPDISIDSSSV